MPLDSDHYLWQNILNIMRYSPDDQAAIRRRLLQAGGHELHKHGFGATGVDVMAKAAGVTSGALYSAYGSKAALWEAVVASELQALAANLANVRTSGDADALAQYLARYLQPRHTPSNPHSCVLPTMSPDVMRAPDESKSRLEPDYHAVAQQMAHLLGDLSGNSTTGWPAMALLIGGVILANSVVTPTVKEEILTEVRRTILRLKQDQTA